MEPRESPAQLLAQTGFWAGSCNPLNVKERMQVHIDHRRWGRGLTILLLCSLVGMGYVFWTTASRDTVVALRHVRPSYLLLLSLLTFLDLWLGGMRNHIFIRRVKPGISPWVSFRANLANIFLGAATPSQTGGGVAQLFVFHRAGVPVSAAIATSVFNFLATMTFFIATVAAIMVFDVRTGPFSTGIRIFVGYSFAVFSFMLLLFLLSLAKPGWLERVIEKLHTRSQHATSRPGKSLLNVAERSLHGFQNYRDHASYFLGEARPTLWQSWLLTLLLYWNKYNIAYTVLAGLGQHSDYLTVIFLQNIQLFLLYFAPTPGASGIAEISAASLMKTQVSTALMPVFAVLWRTFTIYVSVLLGGLVLWRETLPKRTAPEVTESVVSAEGV